MRVTGEAGLVTVCVPTVGRVGYFEETMQCLRTQTYPSIELLVLDNGSPPDRAVEIAAAAATLPRARVLRSEQRMPMFANFNRGIREAQGEYVAFFHDDDWYDPEFLARYVSLLNRWTDAGFAGGNYGIMNEHGETVRYKRNIRSTQIWRGAEFIAKTMGSGRNALATPGLVFRCAALAQTGFDESISPNWGDLVVLSRIAERWDVAVDPAVLYCWRVHGSNGSRVPFSESVPLRDTIVADYARELRVRVPTLAGLSDRIDRRRGRMRWTGLAWGWLTATTDKEADACIAQLRSTSKSVALALTAMDRIAMRRGAQRALLPLARHLANALGV